MTSLPKPSDAPKLGLVIDLDICVGCHACAVNCKEWNSGGHSAPMTDWNTYSGTESQDGDDVGAWGVWFNRVHTYEVNEDAHSRTVHFPRSCLHCEEPACVTVCPTGASYKREEDGIVLVNPDTCIGCKLCSWACPYGAREYDQTDGVMKKCTLCIDKIYNEDEVWVAADCTKKEIKDFLESMNSSQFKQIETFFDTMPKLSHSIKVTNPKTKVESDVVLEGLASFFG